MKVTKLEAAVIARLLADKKAGVIKKGINFDEVVVASRDFTGAGFMTEFTKSAELKLFTDGTSMRWGKVGAKLNSLSLESGYVLYIDNGYLTTLEGYTYGEEWPIEIDAIDLYDLPE